MRGNSMDNQPARNIAAGKPSKLRFMIPLVLVLVAALTACGSSANVGSSSTNSFNDSGTSNSGDLAPDFPIVMFQGQDVVGGQEINFRDLVGKRPIVLNFWAGLCPPCRAEMPDLQAFSEKFQGQVLVLGVDLGQIFGLGNQEDAQDLLDELGVTYPSGYLKGRSVIEDYKIFGIPATVFIDAQGEIFNTWSGALNGEVLEEKTLEMLNQ